MHLYPDNQGEEEEVEWRGKEVRRWFDVGWPCVALEKCSSQVFLIIGLNFTSVCIIFDLTDKLHFILYTLRIHTEAIIIIIIVQKTF